MGPPPAGVFATPVGESSLYWGTRRLALSVSTLNVLKLIERHLPLF